VTVTVAKQDGMALFRVADTGIGIPPEDISKIFDRFYRVDKARSRAMGGTGLGLSIAKWIAELHRGTIIVESVPQKGSVFTVRLPVN
jgi:signal transduction histidine kinase